MSPLGRYLLYCDHGFPVFDDCWRCWQRRALDAEAALKAVASAAMSYDLWMQEHDPRGGVRADHVEAKLLKAWEQCTIALALPNVRTILEAPCDQT